VVTVGSAGQNGQRLLYYAGEALWVNAETINPVDPEYGALGNAVEITDANITTGLNALSSASQYTFTLTDVGKRVIVQNGVAAGVALVTSIQSVAAGVATLVDAAANTVANGVCAFGADDTVAINAALAAAHAAALKGIWATVQLPNGLFIVDPLGGSYLEYGNVAYAAVALPLKSLPAGATGGGGVTFKGSGSTRIIAVPVPQTVLTSSVTLPQASIPVASTKRFATVTGFGNQFEVSNSVVVWGAATSDSFTGCSSGSGTFPAGTIVSQRSYMCIIGTDGGSGASNEKWQIRDLTLDAYTYAGPEFSSGVISIGNSSYFRIENVKIVNGMGKGIDLYPYSYTPAHFRITGCEITSCSSNAIGVDGALTDFEIDNNDIHDIGFGNSAEALVGMVGCQRGTIVNNKFRNYGTVDIAGTDIIFRGNYVSNTAAAQGPTVALVNTVTRVLIEGNILDGSATGSGPPATLSMTGAFVYTQVTISDNTVIAPSGVAFNRAIYINPSSAGNDVVVADNTFINGSGSVISADNGLNGIISGNIFDGAGLQVSSLSGPLTGNVINNGSLSIGISCSVTGNYVNGPATSGIYAVTVAGYWNTISGNRFIGNHPDASSATLKTTSSSANSNVINDNVITSNSSTGRTIWEQSSAGANLFENNQLFGNTIILGTGSIIRGCGGYNPVGAVTVAVPASGTAVAAAGYDRWFYITAGSSGTTSVSITSAGTATTVTIPASSCVPVRVPASQTLTPTYTSAPTWAVYGE
jgi:hypothetical protein